MRTGSRAYDLAWWVNSEQAGLIGDQFAALGAALGCVPAGAGVEMVRAAVLGELRERGRWLLVFDNAEHPADITGWLPGGGGHVLITSREREWTEIAVPVEVDVLPRPESVAILQGRVAGLTEADADRIADQLGDLPLAVAEAAGYMAETGMVAAEYLGLLRTRAAQLLDQVPRGSSYPRSLAAATGLIAERLTAEDPAAAELASMCAFLAPEPIPEDLFTERRRRPTWRAGSPGRRPAGLAADTRPAGPPVAGPDRSARVADAPAYAGDPPGPACPRPSYRHPHAYRGHAGRQQSRRGGQSRLLAWLGAADAPPARPRPRRYGNHADCGTLLAAARWYLIKRGDRTGHDLASDLYQQWRERLGNDHEHTLEIAHYLAWALQDMGRYAEARDLDQDTLARAAGSWARTTAAPWCTPAALAVDLHALGEVQAARDLDQDTLDRRRRVLGEDDPDTLASATNLAADLRALGEVQAARDLDQDTLDRFRRVLGEDHPYTLWSADGLAADLRELGEVQAARDLHQDTLDRRRRVLGEDHPDTLASATNLAADLRALGEVQAARDLDQDTLDRRRRVLGEDHPDTLASASNLAADLRAIGEA